MWLEIVHFFSDSVENIMGKGENAGFQHFLLFLQYFQKASFSGSGKLVIVWEKAKDSVDQTAENTV